MQIKNNRVITKRVINGIIAELNVNEMKRKPPPSPVLLSRERENAISGIIFGLYFRSDCNTINRYLKRCLQRVWRWVMHASCGETCAAILHDLELMTERVIENLYINFARAIYRERGGGISRSGYNRYFIHERVSVVGMTSMEYFMKCLNDVRHGGRKEAVAQRAVRNAVNCFCAFVIYLRTTDRNMPVTRRNYFSTTAPRSWRFRETSTIPAYPPTIDRSRAPFASENRRTNAYRSLDN